MLSGVPQNADALQSLKVYPRSPGPFIYNNSKSSKHRPESLGVPSWGWVLYLTLEGWMGVSASWLEDLSVPVSKPSTSLLLSSPCSCSLISVSGMLTHLTSEH